MPSREKCVPGRQGSRRSGSLGQQILRQAVRYGGHIIGVRQWRALRVGDGNDGDVAVQFVEGRQLGKVQAAMQRRHRGHTQTAQQRISEVIEMRMDHVELIRAARHRFQFHEDRRERVCHARIQAQCPWPDGNQRRFRRAVARGEQGHLVSEFNQCVRQIGDDTFGPAIKFRWHGLDERCNLRNPHRISRSFRLGWSSFYDASMAQEFRFQVMHPLHAVAARRESFTSRNRRLQTIEMQRQVLA